MSSTDTYATRPSSGEPAATSPGDDAPHVLVIDDDRRIRELLRTYLTENGFRVSVAESAEAAESKMRGLQYDLLILDVMMPGENGMDFARRMRQVSQVPILMLTARADGDDRIAGLESGVDDYLPKPFDPRELVLRMHNILKRTQATGTVQDEIRMGDFTFHVERGELQKNGVTVRLTTRERDLLRQFARMPGKAFSRNDLSADGTGGSARAVDVQINRLRRKIEPDPATPVYLQTVRGAGYILYTD